MDRTATCPLAGALAARLRAERDELTTHWLQRIAARVSLDRNDVFPTDELLDHVPILIDGIADYLEDPAEEIAADAPLVAKAQELGALRHEQGFDAYQIFKEYEILGGVLFTHLARVVDEIDQPCTRRELLECAHRVFHAIALIQQVTTMHFLQKTGEQVNEREQRLRAFNRLVSHELKNQVGAIKGAHALLGEHWLAEKERERFLGMIGENVDGIAAVLENLMTLSRLDAGARQQKNVRLPQAAAEAVRQLRGLARARGVAVRLSPDLPDVEVNAAAVELCLTNYLTNAIKYSDSAQSKRWAEIHGRIGKASTDAHGQELIVEVRDNGLGVPGASREKLFQRFFRAHDDAITGAEGTGLGLSLVRETVESLGGRAWAEPNVPVGSVFTFTLPWRRGEDPGANESGEEGRAALVE